METVMRMSSIDTLHTPNKKNTKNGVNGIYVSYAIVIGIHRIILFDHFNNVQGFIFNGSILSVQEAGPALSASILEPLRVSYRPLIAQPSVSPSPASSAFSGTTISDTNHTYNDAEPNEASPDPPSSLLLSAPEYIPPTAVTARITHDDTTSPSHTPHNTTDCTVKCLSSDAESVEPKEQKEEKATSKEEEEGTNNSIVSVVGGRVVLIPPLKSMETKPLYRLTGTNGIQFSYNFRHKKSIRGSGLKRSHTTFVAKRKRIDVNRRVRRSQSCGILTQIPEL